MPTCCLEETSHSTSELRGSQHQNRELMHMVQEQCQLPCRHSPPLLRQFQVSLEGKQECSELGRAVRRKGPTSPLG